MTKHASPSEDPTSPISKDPIAKVSSPQNHQSQTHEPEAKKTDAGDRIPPEANPPVPKRNGVSATHSEETDSEGSTHTTAPRSRNQYDINNLTHLLKDEQDDGYNEILSLIEAELKRMARYKMKQESPSATYDGDDLFSEAALKICSIPKGHWRNTEHFLNAFWLIMKRTLINRANYAKAEIRGGPDKRKNEARLDEKGEDKVPDPMNEGPQLGRAGVSLLDLKQVLSKLRKENLETGEVAALRFFEGHTIEEIAIERKISTANVNRRIKYARRFFEWNLRL